MGITDVAKVDMLDSFFRADSPSNFYLHLCTGASTPTVNTQTLSELTEVTTGGGYSGGVSVSRNSTDFPTITNDAGNDRVSAVMKDYTFSATGSGIQSVAWAVLTDDNATAASRRVYYYWPISPALTATAGQDLRLSGLEIRFASDAGDSVWTRAGLEMLFDHWFNNTGTPTNIYAALCTSATAPDSDTTTLSTLTQISGNGYTSGGLSNSRNTTDFPTLVESSNEARFTVSDQDYTASGGTLGPARYMVLTDDNGTVGSRIVICAYDLESDRNVSDTYTLTISAAKVKLS